MPKPAHRLHYMIQICICQVYLIQICIINRMEFTFTHNRIAELRAEAHVSQRQLAKEVGTSQANLSRWEKGIVAPCVLECWRLAEFFGVTIDYICGRVDY